MSSYSLPPPLVERCGRFLVVRDDALPGGSKERYLLPLLERRPERVAVYATPAYGYAQIAIARACAMLGKRAVIFVAKRKAPHARTLRAKQAGAAVFQVPFGRLNVVQARARAYAAEHGGYLVPFGADVPEAIGAFAESARAIGIAPREVWAAAGSGALIRGLQLAWPQAAFHAVRVGAQPQIGAAQRHDAPEPFEEPAREPPPFPSCDNYDAKVWRFAQRMGADDALIWNVAA